MLEYMRDVVVVVLAERDRHRRVAVGGEQLQPARGLRGERPHVGVALDLRALVQQVTHGRRGFKADLVGERATIRVRVDRDDPVAAQ